MGVSASGERGLSARAIRSFLVVFFVLCGFTYYFYGPPVTPAVRSAATDACNEYAGGNFRSYRLSWVSWPNNNPHWACWDARDPLKKAVNLGWWVNPFS